MIGASDTDRENSNDITELIKETLLKSGLTCSLTDLTDTAIWVLFEPDPPWEREVIIARITAAEFHLFKKREWYVPPDQVSDCRDEYTWVTCCSLEIHWLLDHPCISHLSFSTNDGWRAVKKKRGVFKMFAKTHTWPVSLHMS